MYITLFDLFGSRFGAHPRWSSLAPHNRALVSGLAIMAVLLMLCGIAVRTRFHYAPLIVLGVFCGGIVAKVLGQFLAPKIQSHVTAFLGGITTGNIGTSETGLRKLINKIADEINKVVALLPQTMGDLSDPVTLSLWIALFTTLVILAANAYYANQESSPVGNPVTSGAGSGPAVVAIDAALPVTAAAAAAPGRQSRN